MLSLSLSRAPGRSLALTPTLHRFPCEDDLEASPLDSGLDTD